MTVRELIAALSELPSDAEVVTSQSGDLTDERRSAHSVSIAPNGDVLIIS